MDCSLPGSSIHGILQARILEWVAISFSRGSFWPGDRTWVSHISGRRLNLWATREAMQETLGWEDPLEKEMAIQPSILAWRMPWMEELRGLQSMGLQRVGHDWATSLSQTYFSVTLIIKNEHIIVCIFCLSIIYFWVSLFMTLALFILAISKKN